MKIAFWSNVSGKCYTTANTAAISVMSAIETSRQILVFEDHAGIGGLQDALVRPENICSVRERDMDYNGPGMELLIRKVRAGLYEQRSVSNNIIRLLDDRLLVVPRREGVSSEVYVFELGMVLNELLKMFEQYAQMVVIDTSNTESVTTRNILEMADVIVINICQNKKVIDDIFDNYSMYLEKAFFLVGNYEPYSRMDITSISKCYRINEERIAAIPYNYRFREALNYGNVIDFIEKGMNCRKRDYNYYFMEQLRNAVNLLDNFITKQGNTAGETVGGRFCGRGL